MMRSSFTRSLVFLVAGLAAVTATVTQCTVRICRSIEDAAISAWRFIEDAFKFSSPRDVPKPLPGLAVQLIAAKQYVLRQIKRERPVVFPAWNMSPST